MLQVCNQLVVILKYVLKCDYTIKIPNEFENLLLQLH